MYTAVLYKVSGGSQCGAVTSSQTYASTSGVVDVAVYDAVVCSAVTVEENILIYSSHEVTYNT